MMATESPGLSFLWKDSLTERLIELFKGNPCLYDTKCADYHNRDLKKKILEEIADEVGTTSEKVTKKIKSLRSQYTREKQKERRKRSLAGVDGGYLSKWMHYDSLNFLEEFVIPRQSSTGHKRPDAEEDSFFTPLDTSQLEMVDIPAELTPPTSISAPATRVQKRRRRSESVDDEDEELLVKKALMYMTRTGEGSGRGGQQQLQQQQKKDESDRYAIFGQYVACELKEVGDADLERWAKQQITTILCHAQSGNLPPSSNQNSYVRSQAYMCGPFFRSAPSLDILSDGPVSP